jgi:hypothetical protein
MRINIKRFFFIDPTPEQNFPIVSDKFKSMGHRQ